MITQIRPTIVIFLALTVVTGMIYPAIVTEIAQVGFSHRANGSVIDANGKAVGSELIGQTFTSPGYFWSRPSATSPVPYNSGASSGSNLGPTNPALHDAVRDRVAALRAADPGNTQPVPVDLVTASGSGLDPHIGPAAAAYQVGRVARARGMTESRVKEIVAEATEPAAWGLLGEPRVNVLRLNLSLDRVASGRP
jgi:K+-transporting ATPase ATPase C chain